MYLEVIYAISIGLVIIDKNIASICHAGSDNRSLKPNNYFWKAGKKHTCLILPLKDTATCLSMGTQEPPRSKRTTGHQRFVSGLLKKNSITRKHTRMKYQEALLESCPKVSHQEWTLKEVISSTALPHPPSSQHHKTSNTP